MPQWMNVILVSDSNFIHDGPEITSRSKYSPRDIISARSDVTSLRVSPENREED